MAYGDLSPISREPMRPPAPLRVVFGALFVALLINLLPWSGTPLLIRPDFVLLVLLFWAVHEPRIIGQGMGFALALVMDVADSALLGQHALAYVIATFLAQVLRLRILQLTVAEQALHVGGILFVSTAVMLLLNSMLGRDFPGVALFLSPILGAMLWPVVRAVTAWQKLRLPPPTTMMR
ncbi:MAG: rod shape-determining protein MreD [Betaproteobacteria bacterium]|nr:rod shape-determining protein MreD [Betaproteobacteria bacterium]